MLSDSIGNLTLLGEILRRNALPLQKNMPVILSVKVLYGRDSLLILCAWLKITHEGLLVYVGSNAYLNSNL